MMTADATRQDTSLTTAEIRYHSPDQPELVRVFVWQDYDLAPNYPRLSRFLDYWSRTIEGQVDSVRIAPAGPRYALAIRPACSLALH